MRKNLQPEGPWTFESPEALAGGDVWRIGFNSYEKGKYRQYTPFDQILIKNYDPDNRIDVNINGVYTVDIDPEGKDSYDETGVQSFEVVNVGGTTISAGDITVSVKNQGYTDDDAARERKARHPVENMARGFLNL